MFYPQRYVIDPNMKKVSCCGGALTFSEPERNQALINDIIDVCL
jgi:hypothetical protein